MIQLDITTLQVGTMCILVASSVAAPLIMGSRISTAARFGQGTVIAQTLGWASILVSGLFMQRWFATLGMALVSAGLVCQWHALRGWMGARPGQSLMHALAVLTPLGYAIAFPSYALRVGWANVLIGSQMLLLCLALAWPSPQTSRRWRTLLGLCMAALAVVTLWRGVLGAFYTEAYPYFGAPHPVNLAGALIHSLAVPLGTLALLVAWREEAERELNQLASTDSLTGLLNRRAFAEGTREAMAATERHPQAMALLLIDLDSFKRINDEHGHVRGDQALKLVAEVLQAQRRGGDLVARHGGEEFCVLLRHAGAEEGRAFDARLRTALRQAALNQLGFALNFSSGLAVWRAVPTNLEDWLQQADQAMYQAKAEGRGQIRVL
ncbi:MAG: GGDEF domain-containing protein [Vitreoscilla sp.]|nr:GGDEF domain-containing protein [Vitreoscilla sp.]MBP6675015.1 GGDEF domain-containing protein [Vitreoscilla sp.]